MKLARLMPQLGMGLSTFCLITTAQAGIPVWSFAPDASFPPTVSVSSTGSALVKYIVSNNSSKAHDLVIKPQTGVSQSSPCLLGPKGSASATCALSLTITGSALPTSGLSGGPVLCQANPDGTPNPNECYQPSKANSLAITVVQDAPILSASTANLALSVNDTGINAALTGNPRQITITNSGALLATGLSISYPTWPAGTTVNTSAASACTNGGTLAVGGSCTITIVPGPTVTSGAGNAACTTGIAATPGIVSVTATNANQTLTNVVILGYGCVYQGGFIYSVDDSYADYPESGSIGGKVVSLLDQAEPFISTGAQLTSIIWSSNGSGARTPSVSYDLIPGIDDSSLTSGSSPSYANFSIYFMSTYTNTPVEPSSSLFNACNGASDGSCDTGNILAFYNTWVTNDNASCDPNQGGTGKCTAVLAPPATLLTDYAAGLCSSTIDGYTEWYLPSICEMDAVHTSVTCPVGTQSMLNSLSFLMGDEGAATPSTSCTPPGGTNCIAGGYWSSTEQTFGAESNAWIEFFNSSASFQNVDTKDGMFGVRCSRAF
jgi:hypothetical protein